MLGESSFATTRKGKRAQSLKTAGLEKVSPRNHRTKCKTAARYTEGKGKLASSLSFDIIIPHQRKYFGIIILHIYIFEIKHLLSTLFKLFWRPILLSQMPTQLWRT